MSVNAERMQGSLQASMSRRVPRYEILEEKIDKTERLDYYLSRITHNKIALLLHEYEALV